MVDQTSPISAISPHVERMIQKKLEEEKMLQDAFARLDEDGSGTLDKKEVKKMAKILGDNLKSEQLHNAFSQMDKLNAGEVTYNQFKKWWFLKKDDERKAARKRAKELFNEIDEDGGGTLDIDEVAKMHKVLMKNFPKVELEPPFDLEKDFADMDKTGTGEVSFAEFEYWWRSRTGDDEPDIPVLPESMVSKVNEITSANKRLGTLPTDRKRSGVELWAFLRPRLFLLVEMSKRWGNIHALYPTASSGSIFEEKPLPKWVRNPDSEFSTQWDIAQVFALLYVCYIVPLRASMEMTTPIDSFAFWWDVVVDCYFIADLFLNFRTAFWDARGTLEGDLIAIRKHYIGGGTELMGGYFPLGWFLIDFVSCLPVGYISVFVELANPDADTSKSNFRAFKTLRLLRLAKLLRITRVKKILEKYEDSFDANQYLGLLFTLFTIIFMAHMMACFWYMVGKGEQIDGAGNLVQGWVYNPEGKGWTMADLNPTCEASSASASVSVVAACQAVSSKNSFGNHEVKDKEKCEAAGDCTYAPIVVHYGTRYIIAMFSSFDCSFAFTDAEHGFLMMSILITGFIYGALAGVISTLLMGLASGTHAYRFALTYAYGLRVCRLPSVALCFQLLNSFLPSKAQDSVSQQQETYTQPRDCCCCCCVWLNIIATIKHHQATRSSPQSSNHSRRGWGREPSPSKTVQGSSLTTRPRTRAPRRSTSRRFWTSSRQPSVVMSARRSMATCSQACRSSATSALRL